MQVNLCKDCKFHIFNSEYKVDYCSRKAYTEPVHGLVKYLHCVDERNVMGSCKYQGIHWERK